MSRIFETKGDDVAWCTECASEVSRVIEIAEETFACKDCLGALLVEVLPEHPRGFPNDKARFMLGLTSLIPHG